MWLYLHSYSQGQNHFTHDNIKRRNLLSVQTRNNFRNRLTAINRSFYLMGLLPSSYTIHIYIERLNDFKKYISVLRRGLTIFHIVNDEWINLWTNKLCDIKIIINFIIIQIHKTYCEFICNKHPCNKHTCMFLLNKDPAVPVFCYSNLRDDWVLSELHNVYMYDNAFPSTLTLGRNAQS